jgi:hypothetical protein
MAFGLKAPVEGTAVSPPLSHAFIEASHVHCDDYATLHCNAQIRRVRIPDHVDETARLGGGVPRKRDQ